MFTKDNRTENFLTQMGVDFKYTNDVAFSQLVSRWKTLNIARPVPLREDAVLQYASLMDGGSAAPAPILHDTSGEYDVLDGVQRIAAAELHGSTRISAYVVISDSEHIVSAIRVLANARLQGRQEPPEWTRRRAVEVLVVDRGMSVNEVAKMGGWKPADVARLAGIVEWANKITIAGGPELPDTMIAAVAPHLDGELESAPKPIVKFLESLRVAKFSASDAGPYIEDFFRRITKPAKRQQLYDERLRAFMDTPEVQVRLHGRQGAVMPKDVVLLRTLKSALTVMEEISDEGNPLPYVDEFFRLLGQLEEKLKEMSPNPRAIESRVPADMWGPYAQA